MRGLSRDEPEQIVKTRKIKNYTEMTKGELIISLLKWKVSIDELLNNNNLYDDKISDIRRILSRLRDILPKKDKKEIKNKLYKKENQRNILEENDEYLRKLVRILNNKEKDSSHDLDDLDYYDIRDIETLFGETSEKDNICKKFLRTYLKKLNMKKKIFDRIK